MCLLGMKDISIYNQWTDVEFDCTGVLLGLTQRRKWYLKKIKSKDIIKISSMVSIVVASKKVIRGPNHYNSK